MSDRAPLDEPQLIRLLEAIDHGDAARAIAPYLDSALHAGLGRLARSLGLTSPAARAVERVERFDDGGFFVRSRVLLAHRPAPLVERVLTDGWPVLLLAFGPWGLRPLRGQRAFVEELLREQAHPSPSPGARPGGASYRVASALQESKPPTDMDPLRLATLWAEALGRGRGRSHLVLSSSDEIDTYLAQLVETQEPGHALRHLSLHPAGWPATRSFRPPAIEGSPARGWTLTFVTLFGQNELRTRLTRQHVRIHPDFTITTTEETLCDPLIVEEFAVRGRRLTVSGSGRQARVKRRGGWSGP